MNMSKDKVTLISLIILVIGVLINIGYHFYINEMNEQRKKNIDSSMININRLDKLINMALSDSAFVVLDSLHKSKADLPEYYFIEGHLYDLKNDSLKARSCFKKAYDKYDRLIKENGRFGDKLNHSLMTQVLYGIPAFNKELDSLAKTTTDATELESVEMYKRSFIYEKRVLFPTTMLLFQ